LGVSGATAIALVGVGVADLVDFFRSSLFGWREKSGAALASPNNPTYRPA
jgi:hypothetical protein